MIGTESISGYKTFNNILSISQSTPELKLFTSDDSYYSRLQRSITNNTTYLKAQTTQVGGYGNAISLNGISYYSVTDAGLPSGTKPVITISVWCTVAAAVVLRYGNTNVVGIYSNMFNSSSGFASVSTAIVTGGSGGSNGSWVHYAMTCDGTTTKYYVNGALASSFTTSWVVDLGGQLTTQGIAGISGNNYTGKQTQILIYNTALPATGTNSISSIYNGGAGNSSIPTSGLLRRYDFASITSNTTPDTNPNGTQYPLSLFSSPTLVTGQVPTVSSIVEGIPIQYQDGFNANELGTLYLGDPNSGTWLRGQSIKSLIGSNIPFLIGTNYNTLISPSNTSQSTLSNSPLTVIGGASIGSYTVAAPTNGLLVSGTVLLGTPTTNAAGILQTAGNIVPATNNTYTLGDSSYQWSNIYAGNLYLKSTGNDNTTTNFSILNSSNNEILRVYNGYNISLGGGTLSSIFSITQPTIGIGTLTASFGTSSITGINTQFTNTFKIGDNIFTGGKTYSITSITSDISLGISGTITATISNSSYTLLGGNLFNVYGNGNIIFGSQSTMWYDARYGSLNIGNNTSQNSYKLYVNGSSYLNGDIQYGWGNSIKASNGSSVNSIILSDAGNAGMDFIINCGYVSSPTTNSAFRFLSGRSPFGSQTLQEVARITNAGNLLIGSVTDTLGLFSLSQVSVGYGTVTTTSGVTSIILSTTILSFTGSNIVVSSSLGIAVGQLVSGTTITTGTTVSNVNGTTITLSIGSSGTSSVSFSGTIVTGTNTQFTNTFKNGDSITISGTTYSISNITSNTSLVLTTISSVYTNASYTLVGGNKFNVYGNGNIIFGSQSTMWYDAIYGALNIGSSTSQSTYKLNVAGNVQFGSGLYWDNTNNSLGVGTSTPNSIISNYDNKLAIVSNGSGTSGRTTFVVKNTNPTSAAAFFLFNSSGNGIGLQASGPSYITGASGTIYTQGALPLGFVSDGDVSTGGTDAILFTQGGYSNTPQLQINSSGNVQVSTKLGVGVASPTGQAEFSSTGITGNGTTNWIRVTSTGAGGGFIDMYSSGNIGGGTIQPNSTGWNTNLPYYFNISNSVKMILNTSGRLLLNTTSDDGINQLQVNGSIKSTQFILSAMNTAPSSSTASGTLGEIKIDGNYIYVCTATNTWVRSILASF